MSVSETISNVFSTFSNDCAKTHLTYLAGLSHDYEK